MHPYVSQISMLDLLDLLETRDALAAHVENQDKKVALIQGPLIQGTASSFTIREDRPLLFMTETQGKPPSRFATLVLTTRVDAVTAKKRNTKPPFQITATQNSVIMHHFSLFTFHFSFFVVSLHTINNNL